MSTNISAHWPISHAAYYHLPLHFLLLFNLWCIMRINHNFLLFNIFLFFLLGFNFRFLWILIFLIFALSNTLVYYIFMRTFSSDVRSSLSWHYNIVIDNKSGFVGIGLNFIIFKLTRVSES